MDTFLCSWLRKKMRKFLAILAILLVFPVACVPQRKPNGSLPNLPPNTNRAPMTKDPQQVAEGLAGTAQKTPGVQKVWGIGYDNTVLLGAVFDDNLSAQEVDKVKIAAVNRALRSTTQLVVIKITDQPEQVRRIQAMKGKLQQGVKLETIQAELQALSARIPAVDPERPR